MPMTTDHDAMMRASLDFTLDLADKILMSSEKNPTKAFLNAIGTLAQVIHIITPDAPTVSRSAPARVT